jgi:hypothetical protein
MLYEYVPVPPKMGFVPCLYDTSQLLMELIHVQACKGVIEYNELTEYALPSSVFVVLFSLTILEDHPEARGGLIRIVMDPEGIPHPALILGPIYKLDSVHTGIVEVFLEFPFVGEFLELTPRTIGRLHGEMDIDLPKPLQYIPEVFDDCPIDSDLLVTELNDVLRDGLGLALKLIVKLLEPIFLTSTLSRHFNPWERNQTTHIKSLSNFSDVWMRFNRGILSWTEPRGKGF